MSSKYDKTIQMSHEEEGSYHRREVEHCPAPPATSKNYSTQSYQVVPVKSQHRNKEVANYDSCGDDDNFEEWTTSKKKINHKTRQVETRVSRQLLVEDGKVIADSGPQVTTRIKEDNKVEEVEKEKAPKNKGRFDAIENAPEGESSGRVLGEKKEIVRKTREVREENMQYHDERYKELTGKDVHRRAIQAPHELITITDHKSNSKPRGKMVHYSNKGKKYQDTDEVLEVAKLAIDGSVTKEVKRTKHHEEFSEDELPDEKGEAEELRRKPIIQKSSRRHADLVNDFNDTSTPDCTSDEEDKVSRGRPRESRYNQKQHYETKSHKDHQAFPRYEIDPLLKSLKDEQEYRPASSGARYREHSFERKELESSDDERRQVPIKHSTYTRQRSESPGSTRGGVEIPEEYRLNKQRLLSSKGKSTSKLDRGLSPTGRSHLSHRSGKSHRSHREDASVQAHLTDEEEEERKSMRSSSSAGANSHEKTTRQLQRKSTGNSQRNYYFGKPRPRSPSEHSHSSSSLSDPKEKLRRHGARSKDSGFKSPQSMRTETPLSTGSNGHQQQIYSVSNKSTSRRRHQVDERERGAASPTPTTNSLGQRSVKTTTTTMSAGLADRPLSRNERHTTSSKRQPTTASKGGERDKGAKLNRNFDCTTSASSETDEHNGKSGSRREGRRDTTRRMNRRKDEERPFDTVSVTSLGPLATTIKVPYKQPESKAGQREMNARDEESDSELRFVEDLENLRKRLENINSRTITISREIKDNNEKKEKALEHFDYKPLVANVELAPQVSRKRVVDTYNVRVIENNSPFYSHYNSYTNCQLPLKLSMNKPASGIARLELTSSELGSSTKSALDDEQPVSTIEISNGRTGNRTDNAESNNNEAGFNLNDFVKYEAIPVLVSDVGKPDSLNLNDDDDRVSLLSSCSLRSCRTYDVRSVAQDQKAQNEASDDELNDVQHFPVESLDLDQLAIEKKPAAWVFDPRDGSSTAIKAPPKPKGPEPPKVDAKELAQSRGGRSYYLELIEPGKEESERQRPSSIDSLYTRWNSHGALSRGSNQQLQSPPVKSPTPLESRKSRQIKPASILYSNQSRPASLTNRSKTPTKQQQRLQLPFSGPPLGNRSKSSSCLIGVTRPTKYSIYGGLRQINGDNKPVPRLSYSRAIGPKSQRQLDAQSKTPSRYLKMK